VKSRLLRSEPDRVFLLRLERGDAFVESLARFAGEQGISAARIEGIGAFTDARLGFYDLERKDYDRFSVDEDAEVLSLLGNVTRKDGEPWVHAHVTLGRRDGAAIGGHLFEGHVAATLEVFVSAVPEELVREVDDHVGLALIRP
jgi:predicted DNA-binding protein with PD1-like motif